MTTSLHEPGRPERTARLEAVLFDLDGTLVDSTEDLAAAVNHARRAAGFDPLPAATIRAFIGDGMQALVSRAMPDASLVPAAIERFRAHYGEHLLDFTRPYDGIEALLSSASGLRLAVVTNKPHEFSRRILEGTGLARFFAAVVGGDSGFGRKPDPGPFRAALEALGFRRGGEVAALVVGDGRNDVLGARAAGLAVCGVGYGIGDREEMRALAPDFYAESPARVADLVARRRAS